MGSTVSVSLYFSIKREIASVEIPLPIFVQLFRISLKTHHPCTCYRDRTMSPDDWPQGIDNFDLGKSLSEGVETIQSTPLLSTIFRSEHDHGLFLLSNREIVQFVSPSGVHRLSFRLLTKNKRRMNREKIYIYQTANRKVHNRKIPASNHTLEKFKRQLYLRNFARIMHFINTYTYVKYVFFNRYNNSAIEFRRYNVFNVVKLMKKKQKRD